MLGRMFKLCEFVFFFKTHTIKVDVIVVGNNMTDDRINDDRSFIWGVNYPFKLYMHVSASGLLCFREYHILVGFMCVRCIYLYS